MPKFPSDTAGERHVRIDRKGVMEAVSLDDDTIIPPSAIPVTVTLSDVAGAAGEASVIGTPAPGATDFRLRKIKQGGGVTVAQGAADVTVSNNGNLADAAGAAGTMTLVNASGSGTGNYRIKKLIQGANVVLSQSGTDVTIAAAAGAVGSLASAGGSTIINDGLGPDYTIKGIAASSSLLSGVSANTFNFDLPQFRARDALGVIPSATTAFTPTGNRAMAIGVNARADLADSVTVGEASTSDNARTTLVGVSSSITGDDSILVGRGSTCSASSATVVGNANLANVASSNSIIIGHNIASTAINYTIGHGDGGTLTNNTPYGFMVGRKIVGTNSVNLLLNPDFCYIRGRAASFFNRVSTAVAAYNPSALGVAGTFHRLTAMNSTFTFPSSASLNAVYYPGDTSGQYSFVGFDVWIHNNTGTQLTIDMTAAGVIRRRDLTTTATQNTTGNDLIHHFKLVGDGAGAWILDYVGTLATEAGF